MKVLVIGSGGREHAIIYKLSQSPKVSTIYCAPGNAGIAELATCIPIGVEEIDTLLEFAYEQGVDLTIVGPENPLVLGIVDVFEAHGLRVFGPNKKAAQFEGSKAFTKQFLIRHGIPTADYIETSDYEAALNALSKFTYPLVIKADGLAAGKGVVIPETETEARQTLKEIMVDKIFGDSGSHVVIESFLKGIEASVLCLVDGNTIVQLESAQDYKKRFDGDLGLNTGGMGTYSPSILMDKTLTDRVQKEFLEPFIAGTKKDDILFKGILFVGFMIDGEDLRVLEYNVRFGDPETQSILMRLETDIVDLFDAVIEGNLRELTLQWKKEAAVCVVLAAEGYPEAYEKGKVITGTKDVTEALVLHAGTKFSGQDVLTNGGRVLGVVALGENLTEARNKIYREITKIQYEGMVYRKDIGLF
jgi:phosphoribosylamine--glycine ligase